MAHVTVHGRLSRDPELSFVTVKGDQKAVCRFSVAEDKRFGEDASFFDCQIWGKQAEAIDKFFHKGKEIIVHGHHEQEPYKDNEGKTKRPWRLNVDRFEFCGSKDDSQARADNRDPNIPEGFQVVEDDDDIPF